MKILHVCLSQLPAPNYGGTERVVHSLAKTQAEFGHEVSVLCLPGSRLPFAKVIEWNEPRDPRKLVPEGIEILHFHGLPIPGLEALPHVCTIHGNGKAGEEFPANSLFVSEDHARRHGWTEFVHNGIDPDEYPLVSTRDAGRFVFLAKAAWKVKNLRGAVRVAKAAGGRIEVMGGARPWWCLSRRARFHGSIGGETKLRLLQGAQALLFPVLWDEPFGLAVVEALACGTPVVATPRGSLPEILTPECGVLADDFGGLVRGAAAAARLDPRACRERVVVAFNHRRMTQKYLDYYRRVLAQGKLRAGRPRKGTEQGAEALIDYVGRSRWPIVT